MRDVITLLTVALRIVADEPEFVGDAGSQWAGSGDGDDVGR